MARHTLRVLAVIVITLVPAVGRAEPPAKPSEGELRVKTAKVGMSGQRFVQGVVDQIDADGLTLVEIPKSGEPKEHHFLPTDLLRDGKVMWGATARFSYRWEDVKRADAIQVWVGEDHIDKQMYCVEIAIERRPKGRMPESQKADEDTQYLFMSLYNDIDNGLDVSDDDIKTLFPPIPERKNRDGKIINAASPGGLNREWQAKLDAIREKKAKEQELKAKPHEKK